MEDFLVGETVYWDLQGYTDAPVKVRIQDRINSVYFRILALEDTTCLNGAGLICKGDLRIARIQHLRRTTYALEEPPDTVL